MRTTITNPPRYDARELARYVREWWETEGHHGRPTERTDEVPPTPDLGERIRAARSKAENAARGAAKREPRVQHMGGDR